METLRVQVYVARPERIAAHKAMAATVSAFRKWAPDAVDGETDMPFVGVLRTELHQGGSERVQLYPDLEFSEDGTYQLDRKADAVKAPSPFFVDLYEMQVGADKMPKEASVVVLVGKEVRDYIARFDLTKLCEDAQSGARVFDIETMASEGQDGVSGLVLSCLSAAANLPDTDMWNFSTFESAAEEVLLFVFSD